MTDKDDAFLDDLFDEGRKADASVSDALLERVVADAALIPQAQPRQTVWANLLDMIGGWPAVGGMAMAGVTGLWLGFAPPSSVEDFAVGFLGDTTTVSFVGGLDDFAIEGGLDG